jgi:hypothetical protein
VSVTVELMSIELSGMIWENQSTVRKICPSATLSTTIIIHFLVRMDSYLGTQLQEAHVNYCVTGYLNFLKHFWI